MSSSVNFDEQIVFDQLRTERGCGMESALGWRLPEGGTCRSMRALQESHGTHFPITNLETISMFTNMFKGWFGRVVVEL